MKTSALLALAISATNVATAVKFVSGPEEWHQSLGLKVRELEHDRVELPRHVARAVAPKRQDLKTRNPHIPNSKTVKIRYGPYTVPGARTPGGEGMIKNMPSPSVDKPCSSCMITGLNAGLEYPDGTDANTNTLMWLHHMVMFNIGTGASDATCPIFGAPHMIVLSMPTSSERFFSSGNERTTTFFSPPWSNKTNLGYPIYPADRFGMIADLMNMNTAAKQVYITIYYDYVDGHPSHFQEVKPVWLDAQQCGTSEVMGRTPGAKFDFASSPWTANFEGEIMGMGGHLHDGGVELDIIVDGKVICRSMPTYGTDEQALFRANIAKTGGIAPALPDVGHAEPAAKPAAGGGHGHAGGLHVIAMSICADNKAGVKNLPISPAGIQQLKRGQKWVLRAYYDYSKHAGMMNSRGGMDTVMGIAIMYAATEKKRDPKG